MDYAIPAASLVRLMSAMQQFEMLASVVAESVGVPSGTFRTLDVERGVFVVPDGPESTGEALVIVNSPKESP